MKTESELLSKLLKDGGVIVTSDQCSVMEIADARAHGRMYVNTDGIGFVLRLKKWLDLVQLREAAARLAYEEGGR